MPEGSRFWLPAQRSLADQERWFSLATMAAIVSMLATMVTMVVVANGNTCTDAGTFKDSNSMTCEHYTNDIRNCFHEDAKVRNSNGLTACNACCACKNCPKVDSCATWFASRNLTKELACSPPNKVVDRYEKVECTMNHEIMEKGIPFCTTPFTCCFPVDADRSYQSGVGTTIVAAVVMLLAKE